jgi:hypothetical protein
MEIENKCLVMCAWCGKLRIGNEWIEKKSPNYEFIVSSYDRITHTICEEDAKKVIGED